MKRQIWCAVVILATCGLSGSVQANGSDLDGLYQESKQFESKVGEIRNAKLLAGGLDCTNQKLKMPSLKSAAPTQKNAKSTSAK